MKTIPIAAAANLDSATSVHSTTFRRAVSMAADWLREESGVLVDLIWVDDAATPEGGRRAAQEIIRSAAKAVVGHFASGAALAAVPLYRAARLPVFLPAATADRLGDFPGVYRLCDSDIDYVRWIGDWLSRGGLRRVFVDSDGSPHGQSVQDGMHRVWSPDRLVPCAADADCLLYSGMFAASVAFARARMAAGERRPILLTDDAQSARLSEHLGGTPPGELHVMGFRTAAPTAAGRRIAAEYERRWREPPGIYFFETIAGVQVAAAWLAHDIHGSSVETALGRVAFDSRGELRPGRFASFKLGREGLAECPAGSGGRV